MIANIYTYKILKMLHMYKDVHIYRFWLNKSIDKYTFQKYYNLEKHDFKRST
jgi:hypothetical protein